MVTDFISGDYMGSPPATNALDNPKITRIKTLISGRLSVSARGPTQGNQVFQIIRFTEVRTCATTEDLSPSSAIFPIR
jgi:hypothetical protein